MTKAETAASAEPYAIVADQVGFAYGRRAAPVLQGYSARVKRGNVFAILGPNGRGKTTLLKLLLGTLRPASGSIRMLGQPAFVPQLFHVGFPYRVLDMVLMGRARHVGLFSTPSKRDETEALAALGQLGLDDLAARGFDELSGGQRQLVLFARALASGAEILILDEPTSALDLHNQGIALEWISRLARERGLTVIFTTHHPQHAHAVADDALLMFSEDSYVCGAVEDVLNEANLQRLYGVPMRELAFEYEGETLSALVPVWAALRRPSRR